jgi:IclR family pca regulon transcriptional regulator
MSLATDDATRPAVPDADDRRDFVASLARGLAVIKAFDRTAPAMTLTEVAARTGLTRAAARRFLLTLVELGYVKGDGRRFKLTAKVLDLGYAYLSSLDFPELATPFMEELVRAANESCSASVLDGQDIVYVARIPTRRIMSVSLGIGTRLPAFATSMGRVLLAALDDADLDGWLVQARLTPLTEHTVTDKAELRARILEARTRGWALVDQELETGLRSIAVPVTNRRGETVAAINVSAHASRSTRRDMERTFLPLLRATAERIRGVLV